MSLGAVTRHSAAAAGAGFSPVLPQGAGGLNGPNRQTGKVSCLGSGRRASHYPLRPRESTVTKGLHRMAVMKRVQWLTAPLRTIGGEGGVLFFAATTAVNGSSFLFHVVTSRSVTPATYGALGSLLGLLLVITVPTTALQISITREVAARRKEPLTGEELLPVSVGRLLSSAVLYGGVAFLALLAISPVLAAFLRLPSRSSAVMVAAFALVSVVGLVPRAVLVGELRFRQLSAALIVGAVARLVLGALLSPYFGLDGAMAATVFGEVVTGALLLPALRQFVPKSDEVEVLRVRWRDSLSTVVAFTGFWAFTAVDTVLARRYLGVGESGLYAAASVAAKAAMFLPAAVAIVSFPRFAETEGAGAAARSALIHALAVVLAIAAAIVSLVLILSDSVVSVMFGGRYAGAVPTLRILVFSSAAIALLNVLMHYLLASRRKVSPFLCWVGVVTLSLLAAILRPSPNELASYTTAVAVIMTFTMFIAAFLGTSSRDRLLAGHSATGELWSMSEPDRDVTIVVPCYNPGTGLADNLTAIVEVLQSCVPSFEVIAVSDGSTDGSADTLNRLGNPAVRIVVLPENRGKGEALRIGLAMGRGRYVGFIDADGDVDPLALRSFMAIVDAYAPDVVLGSKRHPLSQVSYPKLRRIYSWGYQQLIGSLFRLKIQDSQTGVKLMRREVLAAVLPRMVEKRFAFDLELFVVARHQGYTRFFEAPVSIRHQFTSTISLRSVWGMLLDTLAIFYRLRLLRYYDTPPGDTETSPVTVARSVPT